jgi:hypothetical protein
MFNRSQNSGNLLKCIFIQLVVVAFCLSPMRTVVADEQSDAYAKLLQEAISKQTTGRMPGAHIVAMSCDPTADPANDNDPDKAMQVDQYFPLRSCAQQSLGNDADGKPLPISRENFAVKIAFDPTYHEGDYNGTQFDVTTIGDVQVPDGITDFYDANGNKLAITAKDITVAGEGEPVTYNNAYVYTAPGTVNYPQSGNIMIANLDANGNPVRFIDDQGNHIPGTEHTQTYTKVCNNYAVGVTLAYVNGQPIYTADCTAVTDCNGPAVAGAPMYQADATGVCKPISFAAQKILGERPPSKTEKQSTSLFIARFNNDYSATEKSAILNLDPREEAVWIHAGETKNLHESTRVSFEMTYEGDNACIYAYAQDPSIKWRVEYAAPVTMEEAIDVVKANDGIAPLSADTVVKKNCVAAPYPASPVRVTFGSMVSPVCTNFNNPDFKKDWKWPKPFTGIVVECIEQTMMNIFVPQSVGVDANGVVRSVKSDTVFSRVQDNLKSAIRGLFALYIIFFGYKLLVGKQVPKREEWMWLGLKFAIVMHFALGSGVVNLLPQMLNVSKSLSLIMMEAGLGTQPPELQAAQKLRADASAALLDAQNAVTAKQAELAMLNSRSAVSEQEIIAAQKNKTDVDAQLLLAKAKMDDALLKKNDAYSKYQDAYKKLAEPQAAYDAAFKTASDLQDQIDNYVKNDHIVGGDFQNPPIAGWGVFKTFGDWKSDIGDGIEIQPSGGGQQIVELDSNNNSNMYQNLKAYTGTSYTLTFDYSPRPTPGGYPHVPEENTIEVYVDNVLKGSYSGVTAGAATEFSRKTINFTATHDGDVRVEFRAAGINDSVGGLIDNISLKANEVPKALADSLRAAQADMAKAALALCTAGGVCHGGVVENGVTIPDGQFWNLSPLYAAKVVLDSATSAYDKAKADYDRLLKLSLDAQDALDSAVNFKATKAALIDDATRELAILKANLAGLQKASDDAAVVLSTLMQSLNNIPGKQNLGYDYCDFRGLTYDKNYMKLWDMMDCKISNYLGLGLNKNADIPQVLLTGIAAVFSTIYGIPILILTIVFLVFMILIMVRVVHIYIMAIAGVMLLGYIAPLIIPAALFKYTKEIFDRWLTQVIGCLLQPIMLFAFMSFMMAAIDTVMYEGNHYFVTVDGMPVNTKLANLPVNGQISSNADGSKPAVEFKDCAKTETTTDKNGNNITTASGSMGCIYQTITIFNTGYYLNEQGNTKTTQAETATQSVECAAKIAEALAKKNPFALALAAFGCSGIGKEGGSSVNLVNVKLTKIEVGQDNRDFLIFIGLLKLLLICFVAQTLLGMVQELSGQLTGIMGAAAGGLTTMSPVPTPSIASTLNQIRDKTGKAVDLPGKIYDRGKAMNEKKDAVKRGLLNAQQFLKDRSALGGAADKAKADKEKSGGGGGNGNVGGAAATPLANKDDKANTANAGDAAKTAAYEKARDAHNSIPLPQAPTAGGSGGAAAGGGSAVKPGDGHKMLPGNDKPKPQPPIPQKGGSSGGAGGGSGSSGSSTLGNKALPNPQNAPRSGISDGKAPRPGVAKPQPTPPNKGGGNK